MARHGRQGSIPRPGQPREAVEQDGDILACDIAFPAIGAETLEPELAGKPPQRHFALRSTQWTRPTPDLCILGRLRVVQWPLLRRNCGSFAALWRSLRLTH